MNYEKNEIIIRDMMSKDIIEVAALLDSAGLCEEKDATIRIEELLNNKSRICIIAEKSNEIVGGLLASYNGFHVFLSHIAIKAEEKRMGIGKLMHNKLLEESKKYKAKGIIADCWLTSAGYFYNLGYEIPGAVFLIKTI
ncbi:MAG: GNAT family N-acetyltransferase [Actinobacteria bacterium]|nr:GNAT family N-acetyltransferase [Chloroflexota bacterium]MBE3129061.1 GNAT family N-acetyltransferase [Actinomycetota bacterium]